MTSFRPSRGSLGGVPLALALVVAACGTAKTVSSTTLPTIPPSSTSLAVTNLSEVDAVHFLNPQVGWVSTENQSRLFMTTDGGLRWTNVSPPLLRRSGMVLAGGLAGAAFVSKSNYWLTVSDLAADELTGAVVLHTVNGGQSWTKSGSFPKCDGNAWLSFVSRSQGWLMVGNGEATGSEAVTIYATTSGGEHWARVSKSRSLMGSPGTVGGPSAYCDKTGIGFETGSVGWISGYCAGSVELQESTDGGTRWHAITIAITGNGGFTLPPIFFTPTHGVLEAGLGTSTGMFDVFYTTSNGGGRWTVHHPPIASKGPMDTLSATSWIVADRHALSKTTDGGITWSSVTSSILFTWGSDVLDFTSDAAGWAVVNHMLWHTADGGRKWARNLSRLPQLDSNGIGNVRSEVYHLLL